MRDLILFFLISFSLFTHAQEKELKRIVSLAPSITETVQYLGKGHLLVGHTKYCPEKSKGVDLGRSPVSLEAIVRCRADMVLCTDTELTATHLKKSSLKNIHYFQWRTLDELLKAWKNIGTLIGAKEKAEQLCLDFEKGFETMKPAKGHKKEKVLMVISLLSTGSNNAGLWVAARESFFNCVLTSMGNENAYRKMGVSWERLSFEALLALKPDKILIINANLTPKIEAAERKSWRKFSLLKAVKENEIYFLGGEDVVRSGPSLIKTYQRMYRVLKK